MSLVLLGVFLTLSKDINTAVIGFALAGGVLGFLYYNFNPARVFMGDTGSLVLGFVISVLCVKFIQLNTGTLDRVLPHVQIFTLSVVFIPVFDTLRVFAIRIWYGRSPFTPDKNAKSLVKENVKADAANDKHVPAPLQGKLSQLLVNAGDTVKSNQPLFVIEAMKMETTVTSPVATQCAPTISVSHAPGLESVTQIPLGLTTTVSRTS